MITACDETTINYNYQRGYYYCEDLINHHHHPVENWKPLPLLKAYIQATWHPTYILYLYSGMVGQI